MIHILAVVFVLLGIIGLAMAVVKAQSQSAVWEDILVGLGSAFASAGILALPR